MYCMSIWKKHLSRRKCIEPPASTHHATSSKYVVSSSAIYIYLSSHACDTLWAPPCIRTWPDSSHRTSSHPYHKSVCQAYAWAYACGTPHSSLLKSTEAMGCASEGKPKATANNYIKPCGRARCDESTTIEQALARIHICPIAHQWKQRSIDR